MLSSLHIENIAVIESADIGFGPGFNVLTGETGAGKSIVIDSISAVLGMRTSRDLIRTGAERALVSAVFEQIPRHQWFDDNLIPFDDSGELQILREISADGRGSCRVNGRAVTVGMLRQLGESLMAIYGQHDSQQLFDEQNHLSVLDGFAAHVELIEDYRISFDGLSELRRKMDKLRMDESEKARRIDNLTYQISQLESANLKPGEDEELASRRKLLRSAGKLMDALQQAYIALSGGDDSDGAVSLLSETAGELGSVASISDELEEAYTRANELAVAADDLADELRMLRDSYDFSENELDEVESRLDVLHKLKKKYGSTTEEMLEYLDKCRQELETIEFAEDELKKLEKKFKVLQSEAMEKAKKLSDARKHAAEQLKSRIMSELSQLDMPKVQFETEFTETDLTSVGMDSVRFLMSANVGEALKPMSKVASGGELSRIMLAIKNVLAENDGIPTLIFDEVDAGVSGRAAAKVAAKLKAVSEGKQVLCVTHLPQIAARADLHFSIEKSEEDGRTYTHVTPLEYDGRKMELARLIGGDVITETTLKSAEELMERG
ncbi:MAG: DNA repair protein RecN [Ruminococcaceae bacterium]|nr:DNA repair protein RecN [Oscillospiraceae bacterium]